MKLLRLLCLFLFMATVAYAQAGGGATGPATSVRFGTSLPSVCQPTGANVFFKSDTGNFYVCGAANTWSLIGGAGSPSVVGSGTTGTIPKFTAASAVGNSLISESGTVVTANGTVVAGAATTTGAVYSAFPTFTDSGSTSLGVDSRITTTAATGTFYGGRFYSQADAGVAAATIIGLRGRGVINAGNASTISAVTGSEGSVVGLSSSSTVTQAISFEGLLQPNGTVITTGTVNRAEIAGGNGGITTATMFKGMLNGNTGTIGTLRGIALDGWSTAGGGSITTSYGIYMDTSIDVGATKYAVYSLSASPSLFTGNVEGGGKFFVGTAPTNDTYYSVNRQSQSVSTTAQIGYAATVSNTTNKITRAGSFLAEAQSTSGSTSSVQGIFGSAINQQNGNVSTLSGLSFTIGNNGSGTITNGTGLSIGINQGTSGGTYTAATGLNISSSNGAGSTMTTLKGINIGFSNSGTVGTSYGIYMDSSIDVGSTKYAIYSLSTSPSLLTGDMQFSKTVTGAGTTGAQTINNTTGSVNFAAAATSLVVTNNLVSTSSIIQCTVATNDATFKSAQCVAGSGSFTIHANAAATAETRVNFMVTN